MSEQQTAAVAPSAPAAQPDPQTVATQTPVVATPAVQQPDPVAPQTPQPPAQPEKPRVMASDLPDDALAKRLEDAKRSAREEVYRSLGKTETEIKALLDAEQARIDAQKTLEQKNAEQALQLKEAQRYREAVEAQVSAALPTLSAEQQAVIELINDPATKLQAIARLKTATPPAPAAPIAAVQPTATQGTAAADPAPAPPAKPAPTATAPAPSAPGDSTPTSPPDHAAVYRDLKERNPFVAAEYANAHPEVWGGMVRG